MEAVPPPGVNLDRVTFTQLTWLPNEVGHFDFILAGSFDRVQNVKGICHNSQISYIRHKYKYYGIWILHFSCIFWYNALTGFIVGCFDSLDTAFTRNPSAGWSADGSLSSLDC